MDEWLRQLQTRRQRRLVQTERFQYPLGEDVGVGLPVACSIISPAAALSELE